jgi:hypothetical protein
MDVFYDVESTVMMMKTQANYVTMILNVGLRGLCHNNAVSSTVLVLRRMKWGDARQWWIGLEGQVCDLCEAIHPLFARQTSEDYRLFPIQGRTRGRGLPGCSPRPQTHEN